MKREISERIIFLWKKSWKCRYSNPGPPGKKQVWYPLCYAAPPPLHLEVMFLWNFRSIGCPHRLAIVSDIRLKVNRRTIPGRHFSNESKDRWNCLSGIFKLVKWFMIRENYSRNSTGSQKFSGKTKLWRFCGKRNLRENFLPSIKNFARCLKQNRIAHRLC